MDEIEFSQHERRAFKIPQDQKLFGPEAAALRGIIDEFPFMVDVAECDYDPQVVLASIDLKLAQTKFEFAIQEYYERESKESEVK